MKPSVRIVAVVGNPGDRSRTKVLAQAITDRLLASLAAHVSVHLQVLEIARLAPSIGRVSFASELPPEGAAALRAIESADLIVAATPVYKGSYTGLFKHLFDLLDPEALVGRPVLLAANGGSDRHSLVVDHQVRPLFAFFRALTLPSAVYASEIDFDGYSLRSGPLLARIDEAVLQATHQLVRPTPRVDQRLAA